MSLTPIAATFLLVAAVFNAVALVTAGWRSGAGSPGSEAAARPRSLGAMARVAWPGATFEALILTLVAALWFASLGHGGWVTLFLLLGALPAGDRWLQRRLSGGPAAGEGGLFVASLLKYLLAGLVCSWLLS